MKSGFGILAGSALGALMGFASCTPCTGEGDEYLRERREISLRLVSALDSFRILHAGPEYAAAPIPVREVRNDALGDTVICRFFGMEGRYDNHRFYSSVVVDSAGVRIFHEPMPANRVEYRDSARTIQVLAKAACEPMMPIFHADSIRIERAGGKRIVFDTSSRRD